MSADCAYRCACFFTRNFFSTLLRGHFRYVDKSTFLHDYGHRLGYVGSTGVISNHPNSSSTKICVDQVIDEFEAELRRRRLLGNEIRRRKERIVAEYTPKHAEVYALDERFLAPEFLRLWRRCRDSKDDICFKDLATDLSLDFKKEKCDYAAIFSFPVFTAAFCKLLLQELGHFELSSMPKGRPNTMNRKGVLLDELLGFKKTFVDGLRTGYVQPIVEKLFPGFKATLDSQKAFTVSYQLGEDVDLSYHYDNAEITLNVCLGADFSDGELYFGDVKDWTTSEQDDGFGKVRFAEVRHVMGRGILHLGAHRHGALPISHGDRHNLILWFRSSEIRNQLCPMCGETPELVSVEAGGDGFSDTA